MSILRILEREKKKERRRRKYIWGKILVFVFNVFIRGNWKIGSILEIDVG